MGKTATQRRLADNEALAVGRMIRTSPQKLNLLAQLIRGKKAETAINDLTFSRRRVAGQVKKVLESAIANAENNHALDVDNLTVAEAYVGKNLVMKRYRPRAKGRAGSILKPFSQLTIVLRESEEDVKAKPKTKTKTKAKAKAEAKPQAKAKPKAEAQEKAKPKAEAKPQKKTKRNLQAERKLEAKSKMKTQQSKPETRRKTQARQQQRGK